jgi:hypothetical protein
MMAGYFASATVPRREASAITSNGLTNKPTRRAGAGRKPHAKRFGKVQMQDGSFSAVSDSEKMRKIAAFSSGQMERGTGAVAVVVVVVVRRLRMR